MNGNCSVTQSAAKQHSRVLQLYENENHMVKCFWQGCTDILLTYERLERRKCGSIMSVAIDALRIDFKTHMKRTYETYIIILLVTYTVLVRSCSGSRLLITYPGLYSYYPQVGGHYSNSTKEQTGFFPPTGTLLHEDFCLVGFHLWVKVQHNSTHIIWEVFKTQT